MSAKREVIPLPVRAPDTASGSGQPLSMAVRGGDFLFVSGLTAIDLRSGERMQGTTASETRQILTNLSRNSNLPHVPGIRVGDYIFLSGMVPVDPQTGERSHGPIAEQVRVTLSNMRHMLESAGSSLERVLRVHVVLADISHMAEMDRVYREFFPVDPPARTAWSMQLRFGNGCEIECVALAG